jgi:hypothetical protein
MNRKLSLFLTGTIMVLIAITPGLVYRIFLSSPPPATSQVKKPSSSPSSSQKPKKTQNSPSGR